MKITLKRISHVGEATFGVLLDSNNEPFAVTGERAWVDNASNVSCIPVGEYECIKHISPKHGHVVKILGVPNRSNILFHKGNIPEHDSLGCILVGEQFGILSSERAVLSSRAGFTEFMKITPDKEPFTLEIVDA